MQEIEELFRKLRHHYRLFLKGSNDSFIKMNEIETDLLSRFRELQKYKDTFDTLWDFCSEQTHKQIELVKRAEQAEEQAERLKCLLEERK
jgi:RNAse (barnase) inhibitor barstar